MDRSNTELNYEIERFIDTWDGTGRGQRVRNMYENGDCYDHICEEMGIESSDYIE